MAFALRFSSLQGSWDDEGRVEVKVGGCLSLREPGQANNMREGHGLKGSDRLRGTGFNRKDGGIFYLTRSAAGGMRRHVQNLLSYFSCRCQLCLVAPREDISQWLQSGVELLPLTLEGGLSLPGISSSVRKLYIMLCRRRPGLLHIHGFKAALTGCPAAILAGVPFLITAHNYPSDGMGALLAPFLGRAALRYGRFIAVSRALGREITAWGVPPEQVTVIHNGIDPAPYEEAAGARSFAGKKNGSVLVGTVGRLTSQKGIGHFLRGAAILAGKYTGMRFVIVGEGPERAALENEAARLGLGERLQFRGYCEDLPGQLALMDIFVLSSLTEGQAIVLLEALASGCAVVASAVGGVPEVVENEVTGLLVPPGDEGALAGAVARLTTEKLIAGKMAIAGRKRVRELFTLRQMLSRTETVYREMLLSGS